jgi:hypothetical protein
MTPRMWLYLTIPATLVAIFVCTKAFIRIARTSFTKALLTAPLLPEQTLDFAIGGDVALYLGGPIGTTKFAFLKFALIDEMGQAVPSRMILFRMHKTTLEGRVRLEYRQFSLPRPGRYRLIVTGMRPGVDYSECGLSFDRPFGPSSPEFRPFLLMMAGALLGLAGAICGIVFSAQILLGVWDQKVPASPQSAESRAQNQGRQLTQERADTSQWQAIAWAEQNIRFRLPPGWRETERTSQELVFGSPEPHPVTLRLRVSAAPAIMAVESMRAALEAKARDDLTAGYIEGYELRKLGGLEGVLTIQQRRDGAFRFVVWQGYVGPPEKSREVTFVISPPPGRFDGSEPVLAAILDSVRLE